MWSVAQEYAGTRVFMKRDPTQLVQSPIRVEHEHGGKSPLDPAVHDATSVQL